MSRFVYSDKRQCVIVSLYFKTSQARRPLLLFHSSPVTVLSEVETSRLVARFTYVLVGGLYTCYMFVLVGGVYA